MKNIFVISFFIVLFCHLSVDAQLIKNYGVKVAFTSAAQSFEHSPDGYIVGLESKQLRRNGYNVAFFVEWIDSSSISIVSQFEYNQRGMGFGPEYDHFQLPPDFNRKSNEYCRVDYISLPIMLKLSFPVSSLNSYIIVGPRVDFFLGYGSHSVDLPVDAIYKQFAKTIYGGCVGFGFNYTLGLPLTFEFRRNIDFVDSYSNHFRNIKNDSYDLWLGISF